MFKNELPRQIASIYENPTDFIAVVKGESAEFKAVLEQKYRKAYEAGDIAVYKKL